MNAAEAAEVRRTALQRLAETAAIPRPDFAADEAVFACRERRRNRVLFAVLWFATAYPLSAGPVVYAVERGWLPPAAATGLYAPLIGLGTVVRPVGEAVEWYTRPFAEAGRSARR
jgi:hypothetical protein